MNREDLDVDKFTFVANASPTAVGVYAGSDMKIVVANREMLQLWGKDESVIGLPLQVALPEIVGQPFIQWLQEVYQTGNTHTSKEQKADLLVDGKLQSFYFSFTYKAIINNNQKVIGIINTATDVTELVHTRRSATETQERLALALSSSGIGIWEVDPINKTVQWDNRCCELFGICPNGAMKMDDTLNAIHTFDRDKVYKAVLAALQFENNGVYDARYRTTSLTNGEYRWVHSKGKAYKDENNRVFRFAGTVQDVTAEIDSQLREQQLLSLVSRNADHMSIADMEGRVLYMNAAAKSLLGVQPDEDVTKYTAKDFYEPSELERVQGKVLREIDSQAGWQGEISLINLITKEVIPCQVNYILIKDPISGEVIGRGATARDLRPELKTRQAMAEKNTELHTAVTELEFLANMVPSVVWTTNAQGEIDWLNKRWYEKSGLPPTDDIDRMWQEAIHPEDYKRAVHAWKESLQTGNSYEIEFRFRSKEDGYRWYLVRALPLRDEEGNIVKWYGTNADVQVQKELQQQKDNFLGIASHELKTPVTSLKAYSQVMELMFNKSGDAKNAALVSKMDKQLNRLNNLIGDLLDVTKINTGKLQFNLTTFSFSELIDEVVEDMQRTTHRHTIKKNLSFNGLVTADRERLNQVVVNLLSNAIKYSPEANEIIIHTEKKDNELQLCVQDFGIGIQTDKKDKVFEQFYRVSGTTEHTFPGLGLGLFISSEIVKRLGGKMWVNSVENKGSMFCFSIPLATTD